MTLKTLWKYLMTSKKTELKKSASRVRPIRSDEMPDKCRICDKCNQPWNKHVREKIEKTGKLVDLKILCPPEE